MAKVIKQKTQVAIVMGSSSDWETMKNASLILKQFGVAHERKVVSAHRTPEYMCEFAKTAKSNGIKVIIAGAGGAAHLPGMIAAQTSLPVLGVPVKSSSLNGIDSLLSIVQMPAGVPSWYSCYWRCWCKECRLFGNSDFGIRRFRIAKGDRGFSWKRKEKNSKGSS